MYTNPIFCSVLTILKSIIVSNSLRLSELRSSFQKSNHTEKSEYLLDLVSHRHREHKHPWQNMLFSNFHFPSELVGS